MNSWLRVATHRWRPCPHLIHLPVILDTHLDMFHQISSTDWKTDGVDFNTTASAGFDASERHLAAAQVGGGSISYRVWSMMAI